MNRTSPPLLAGLLVWIGLGLLSVTAGELQAPQRVIQETSSRLHAILLEDRERLLHDPEYVYRLAQEIFLPHVDMERISQMVLGRHWRSASAQQQQAFTREFERLLVRTYATALRELKDWDMRFIPTQMKHGDDRTLVRTEIRRDGAPPLSVDYSMARKEGRWLAYDVQIEGVSLVSNYRNQFADLIRRRGLEGLIQELATMTHDKPPSAGHHVAVRPGTA
jgi:phospholipid transport system substrate-binding protein